MESKARARVSTSRVLSEIRKASAPDQATAFHSSCPAITLKDEIYDAMSKRSFRPKDVIRSCGIERSYFYHILNGIRCPSRNMMLRLCLCIGTDLNETNRLLRLADHPVLYAKVRRDALLIYAIERHLTMEQANQTLLEYQEDPLYREESNG